VSIERRLRQYRLELQSDRTHIVYRKDADRGGEYAIRRLTSLGLHFVLGGRRIDGVSTSSSSAQLSSGGIARRGPRSDCHDGSQDRQQTGTWMRCHKEKRPHSSHADDGLRWRSTLCEGQPDRTLWSPP
jgi:hypothetical protein